jgi:hypothetical protein
VSGQAYVAGDVVWSPSTYLSYRAVGATSGTTDPSQSASWVLLAADVPKFTNPLAQAVSVQMTAATSGSNGIQQLDNDNLDMGTNDFTLTWEGSLPDWTPASAVFFVIKTTGLAVAGYYLALTTTGLLVLNIRDGVNPEIQTVSTVSTGLADGSSAKITAVVTRETASSAGSVVFYVNGVQLGSAVTISAATPLNANGSTNLFISGQSAVRVACSLQASRLFNRALTSAEVLDLSINGPALADRGASQTPVYESDFSATVDGWSASGGGNVAAGNIDGVGGEDDWFRLSRGGAAGLNTMRATKGLTGQAGKTNKCAIKIRNEVLPIDRQYFRVYFDNAANGTAGSTVVQVPNGTTETFLFQSVGANAMGVVTCLSNGTDLSGDSNSAFYLKEIEIKQIGLTSELLASNAQSNTGQIFDTSGNKNHALLPASGATVVGLPVSQTREVRWTNTWAGTNELQYIGGVNQAILPANAYIESIVGTVSGATPHDIIIGDGSDADRYVTITTGLAAGTTSFTLASRTTDGTNLKLTVDPDTNSDMSIAWVIKYTTLEG